jgi:hypothetical protein
MSSFFSSKSSGLFHSVVDEHVAHPERPLFGPLEANDLYWTCAGLAASTVLGAMSTEYLVQAAL